MPLPSAPSAARRPPLPSAPSAARRPRAKLVRGSCEAPESRLLHFLDGNGRSFDACEGKP